MEKIKNFFRNKKAAVAAMAFALCLLCSGTVNAFAGESSTTATTVDWSNAASVLASDLVTMLNSLVPALVPIFATFIGIRVFLKLARRFTK